MASKSNIRGVHVPVHAVFAIHKPSGPPSMSLLNRIKPLLSRSRLFQTPDVIRQLDAAGFKKNRYQKKKIQVNKLELKIGQGGTLDPLASGVLVVGVGKGTKKLGEFIECDKEYEATILLGSSTTTYDSEGAIFDEARWDHVTPELVKEKLPTFTGIINQIPPVYSALKMDGKPLYEYARSGKPLPRPIEARPVTIHSLELIDFHRARSGSEPEDNGHDYLLPSKKLDEREKENLRKTLHSQPTPSTFDPLPSSTSSSSIDASSSSSVPPAFTIRMSCSGGTYVRSLAHDLCHSFGSAGHVVKLVRTRQGNFAIEDCVDWDELLEGPTERMKRRLEAKGEEMNKLMAKDYEGLWAPWEERIADVWRVVGDEDREAQERKEDMSEGETGDKKKVEVGD